MKAGVEIGTRFRIIGPDEDQAYWNRFLSTQPNATLYHHPAWAKILRATYGYTPVFIASEEASTGEITGCLPLMLVNSRLTGNRLSSMPFAAYCDPLTEDGSLPQFIDYILGRYPHIDYLELKSRHNRQINAGVGGSQMTDYMTHILDIDLPREQLFKSFHKSSIQQRINRAGREGLTFRLGCGEEDIHSFFRLEIATRKKHGLPPAPLSFFMNVWHYLEKEGLAYLPMIEYNNAVVAAAILLRFKDTFYFEYSASDKRFLKLSPNQLLIWESIKLAQDENARFFDFGRSHRDHASLIEFKERWNAKRIPLFYHYLPAKNFNTGRGARRRLLESVNRFMPHPILRIQGELIYPHLG